MSGAADQASLALEAVLATFGSMVRGVGWRHRLSDADVDEVMQEVRIRLWRSKATGEQIAGVASSYVYRIAVSAALDLMRRRRTRRVGLAESIDDSELPASTPNPHAAAEALELSEQVARAVETIPATRRPVVRMYLAGYPREEIADLLGWSEAKTRNLLYRGLADLRSRLTEWGIGWEAPE